jgi:hypothetical protein
VRAEDASGNLAAEFSGTISIALGANPGNTILSGTLSMAAQSGVATFSDLSLTKAAGGYTLVATSSGLTSATSGAFAVTPAAAAALFFTVQPSDATAGAAISPAIQVTARDAFGNTASGFTGSVTVALATNPAGGTLSGTATVVAVAGVTTFSDLSLDKAGSGYTLGVSAPGLTGASSAAFAVSPAAAAQLIFTAQPSDATAGVEIAPAVEVTARDAFGNTATGFNGQVTIALGENPGGATLSGTTTVAAAGGIATFGGLSVDKAGAGYRLVATATGVTGDTSTTFAVAPASASQLAFTVQPSDATAGVAIAPAVEVTVRDAFGNTATDFAGNISLAIGNNPGGGALSGTASVAATAGVASFSDLSVDKAGSGYTIVASATGLTGATSGAFAITPAAAGELVFTVQPGDVTAGVAIAPAVEVAARDAFGNVATGFTGSVTLVIGTNSGGGTLSGTTTVTAASGVAGFSDLSIEKAGSGYTLVASAPGLADVISGAFAVSPAAAAELVFTVEPSDATAGSAISPAVEVTARDPFGNTATGFAGSVSLGLGANPGGGTLSGTTTVAAAAGVAGFADLSIEKAAAGYTVVASAAGLPNVGSRPFDVSPAAAATLAPVSGNGQTATVGTALPESLVVRVTDEFGNAVAGVTVTWSATAGGGAVSPSGTPTDAAGLAATSWTLGNAFGEQVAEASAGELSGSPSEFTATALPVGTTRLWVGGTPGFESVWGNPSNWAPTGVPAATDNVFIPASADSQPRITDTDYTIQDLVLEDGASLDIGLFQLTVTGDVTAGSSITGTTGALNMTGPGKTLSGVFPNLAILGPGILPTGDVTVNGTLTVGPGPNGAGSLNLDGHSVTVNGAFVTTLNGAFTMQNPADSLRIFGNATIGGGSTLGLLTDGVIELTGNFYQGEFGSQDSPQAYAPSGAHKIVFNGTGIQTVLFENPDSVASYLWNVDFANPDSVVFECCIGLRAYILGQATILSGKVTSNQIPVVLMGNLADAAGGRWQVPTTHITGANPSLPDSLRTDLTFLAPSALSRGFTVVGDLDVTYGSSLNLNGHTVKVLGDFVTSRAISAAGGVLVMQNPADTLRVAGDVTFLGESTFGLLTAGQIEVTGDFSQGLPGLYGDAVSSRSFAASGSHRTVFNGTLPQTLFIRNPADTMSRFQSLLVAGGANVTMDPSVPNPAVVGEGDFDIFGGLTVPTGGFMGTAGTLFLRSGSVLSNSGTVSAASCVTEAGATVIGNPPCQ